MPSEFVATRVLKITSTHLSVQKKILGTILEIFYHKSYCLDE